MWKGGKRKLKKLYRKEKYKTKTEWLKNRGFGGSSASAIFGVNPYMTKLDIYCASVNKNEIESDEDSNQNDMTIYGQNAEPIIRELVKVNLAQRFRVQSPNGLTMYRRKDKPYMTATLDGLLIELLNGDRWILEIKTHEVRGEEDYLKWQGTLPINYAIQCLHYMVTLNDTKGCLLVAKLRWVDYDTNEIIKEEIRYYWMPRQDYQDKIDEVERVETKFYENHIVKRIPPDVKCEFMEGEKNELQVE